MKPLKIVLSIIFAITLLAAARPAPAAEMKDLWDVPAAAWRRPLGDHPEGAFGALSTKRGVLLDGGENGGMMFNLAGSFGPWIDPEGKTETRFLKGAAFHVREMPSDGFPRIKTLQTEDLLENWRGLRRGQGEYAALGPRGWITFGSGFHSNIAMTFMNLSLNWQPPAAVFLFAAENPTSEPLDLSLMFTFPDADQSGKIVPLKDGRAIGFADVDKGLAAVRLYSENNANSWALAAFDNRPPKSFISFRTAWDPEGKGEDIMADFRDDGTLGAAGSGSQSQAGAVAAAFTLAPGQRKEIAFFLAWNQKKGEPFDASEGADGEKQFWDDLLELRFPDSAENAIPELNEFASFLGGLDVPAWIQQALWNSANSFGQRITHGVHPDDCPTTNWHFNPAGKFDAVYERMLLAAGNMMALHLGEKYESICSNAKQNDSFATPEEEAADFERQFWIESEGYYGSAIADNGKPALFAYALNGFYLPDFLGDDNSASSYPLPLEHLASHFNKVYEWAVAPLRDYDGDGEGDMGAAAGAFPGGKSVGDESADVVRPGDSYILADMMYRVGRLLGDDLLKERALKLAHGAHFQTWDNEENAFWFNVPESYARDNPKNAKPAEKQSLMGAASLAAAVVADKGGAK